MPIDRGDIEIAPDPERVARIQRALLSWFAAHRRVLPWRGAGPYAVWVSEIMLQQTQVQTVIPYFTRWMERFPTVRALADAPLEEVLRYWAGLGYYARARNLHAAAKEMAARHDGALPANLPDLLALPGIGRYTAGAILSIAYGISAPILDANAIRVYSRLFLVAGDPASGSTRRQLWELAELLAPAQQPGDFNQAVMDLGATVCLPEAPECRCCPAAAECAAWKAGRPTEFPQTRPRPKTVTREHVSVVIRDGERVLLAQRPSESLWGGLWEFPRAERAASESLEECACRAAQEAVGLTVCPGVCLAVVRHTVTRHRITLRALAGTVVSGTPRAAQCSAWAWATPEEAARYPLSAPQSRVLRAIRQGLMPPALRYNTPFGKSSG